MCPTIFQKIQFFPKVLWEHHSIQYFLHTIFFSVTVLGPGRYPNQHLILYDQRSSSMILWKRRNFGESKLLWAYNGLKFIVYDDEEKENGGKKLRQYFSKFTILQPEVYLKIYIGTTKFLTKVLWVYSHFKSDFFSKKKLLNSIQHTNQSLKINQKLAKDFP